MLPCQGSPCPGRMRSVSNPLSSLSDSRAWGLFLLKEPGMTRGVRSPVTMLSVTSASPVNRALRSANAIHELPSVCPGV